VLLSTSFSSHLLLNVIKQIANVIGNKIKKKILIFLILPAPLGPEDYSVPNRYEYKKHKNNNVSGG
jgi:hypothetical protein